MDSDSKKVNERKYTFGDMTRKYRWCEGRFSEDNIRKIKRRECTQKRERNIGKEKIKYRRLKDKAVKAKRALRIGKKRGKVQWMKQYKGGYRRKIFGR